MLMWDQLHGKRARRTIRVIGAFQDMCADYLDKLSARKPVVCKALIAANGKKIYGSLKNKIVILSLKKWHL